MLKLVTVLSAVSALLMTSSIASAHEIPWPRGASQQAGFGHCAKGPCMKRSRFASSVPHRHVAPGWCAGMGAAGYTHGRRFKC